MWKEVTSNIIMGRLCYCCLNFLNIRADQLVDRSASTRDIYISIQKSQLYVRFCGKREGFGSVQSLGHTLTLCDHMDCYLCPASWVLCAYWKPKKKSKFTIQSIVSTECVDGHFCTIIKLRKNLESNQIKTRLSVH